MKQIIDTNALLRFLLNDIPDQKKSVEKLLQRAKKGQAEITVPQIVIFELHFILDKYYHFEKEKIISTLQSVVSTDYLQTESKEVFLQALIIYKTTTISLADCFLVAYSKREKAEVFTFDKNLQKLSGSK